MSWMAHEWAESAPVADVQEFAILSVMAQYANKDGTGVFKSPVTIAEIIRCDEKTVKRRIQAMVRRGLLGLGDQRLAAYIPKNKRPVVYDLLIPYSWYSAGQLAKVNADRSARGLGPLRESDRPPIKDAGPSRKRRSDHGVPRPRRAVEGATEGDGAAPNELGGTSSPVQGGLLVQAWGDYKTPNTVLQENLSFEPPDQDQKKRSADAPSPHAATADDTATAPSFEQAPPPNYFTEPDEWIEYKTGGLDGTERNLAEAMLDRGEEPKKVLSKILKDRESDVWDRSAIRGKWLPYVKRKVGGWRAGEYDYARKLLADYHPDIVVEELLCAREQKAA